MGWPYNRGWHPARTWEKMVLRLTQRLRDSLGPESDEVLEASQWALRRGLRKGGPESYYAVAKMIGVADALEQQGHHDEELILRQQIVTTNRRNLGEHDELVMHAELNLGICLCRLQRFEEARVTLTQVAPEMEDRFGPDDPNSLTAIGWLGHVEKSLGHLEEARSMQEKVVARYEMRGDGESIRALTAFGNLADTLEKLGEVDEAVRIYRHLLDVRSRTLGPDDSKTLDSLQNLAIALYMNRLDLPDAKVMAASSRNAPDYSARTTRRS
jgi:tetratricopeptide (TPR) repeat protein